MSVVSKAGSKTVLMLLGTLNQRINQRMARTNLLSLVVLLSLLLSACLNARDDVPPLEQRANALNSTIMCPICPGESIDQAQNTLANQMREIVRQKLETGESDQQIKDFFVERYGPSVILEPPTQGFSIAAWIIPPVAVFAAVVLFFFALHWMRRSPTATANGEISNPRLTEKEYQYYYSRIEATLEGEDKPKTSDRTQSEGVG